MLLRLPFQHPDAVQQVRVRHVADADFDTVLLRPEFGAFPHQSFFVNS
jgi:hypothetical protein